MKIKYFERLKEKGVSPNFWVSEEYFEKAGLKEIEYPDESIGIIDPAAPDCFVFPLINSSGDFVMDENRLKIWSDFAGQNYPPLSFLSFYNLSFLDFEFIYDPFNFSDMKGKKWEVFRKNSRKFKKRNEDAFLCYIRAESWNKGEEIEEEILDLFKNWLKKKDPNQEICDEDTMIKYLLEGESRKILLGKNNKILGINIWDENWVYINFRYCFCLDLPFLSEYMRLLFYQDLEITQKYKLVNDGGCLGNENLEKFKMKMNPIRVRNVCSWIPK